MKSILDAKEIPDNTSGIYLIKSPSGSTYIGQSKCLKRRLIEHKCPSRKTYDMPISKEFLNNDLSGFLFDILEACEPKELNNKEEYWINKLKPDLNISSGGYAATGHIVSDLVKEKLREYGKKQWDEKSDFDKEKIIKFNLTGRKSGFSHSDEVREKISRSLTGKKQPKSVVDKRSKSMKKAMLGNINGVKGVCSYLNGDFVSEFNSIKDAAKSVNTHPSGISKATRSGKICGGFNWKLKGE